MTHQLHLVVDHNGFQIEETIGHVTGRQSRILHAYKTIGLAMAAFTNLTNLKPEEFDAWCEENKFPVWRGVAPRKGVAVTPLTLFTVSLL